MVKWIKAKLINSKIKNTGQNPIGDSSMHELYAYSIAPYPHPGTGNLVRWPLNGKNELSAPVNVFSSGVRYPGTVWNPRQPPQITVATYTKLVGLGGMQNGQLVHQALYDPNVASQIQSYLQGNS